MIGEFSDGIGTTAEAFGYGAVGGVAKALRRKPKDIPALKRQISETLKKQKCHILVLVDDIDRLTPEDIRQLFKVIKALADFPNVAYLLAFDREMAVKALTDDKGISGEAYLEKIVQVPFELPAVDRTSLRNALFRRLDELFEGTPSDLFDSTYWGNIYFEGIDPLIQVPRDIVRLINTLTVTYATVKGEVNPVDFVAIEVTRLFLPEVYSVIRANSSDFTGHSDRHDGQVQQQLRVFHDRWLDQVPEDVRSGVKQMLVRLFPKLGSVWSNTNYGADWELEWRKNLRICSPDIFPVYFRLAVSEGAISKADLSAVLRAAETNDGLREALRAATRIRRPDGSSKARALLERLVDLVKDGIPVTQVDTFVRVLLQIGDELLLPEDEHRGLFDRGNELRVARLIYHLLKRKDESTRCQLLTEGIAAGQALGVIAFLVGMLTQEIEKSAQGGELPLISAECGKDARRRFIILLKAAAMGDTLLSNRLLPSVLYRWREWGKAGDVKSWVASIAETDEGLTRFICSFAQITRSQKLGDSVGKTSLRLNPKWVEPFIDIHEVAARLENIARPARLGVAQLAQLKQFSREYRLLKEGKDPDGPFALED